MPIAGALALLALSGAGASHAGTVNSGSTGADGALYITQPGTYYFDPSSYNPALDADGDGVYNFTTVNIGTGVIVKMRANLMGTKPVVWLATGDVRIDGTLDLNGEDGHHHNSAHIPSIAGAGGYHGGEGGTSVLGGSRGGGPGGGTSNPNQNVDNRLSFGAGASHVTDGRGNVSGSTYGNKYLLPLVGGSGGGGGSNGAVSGGGGAGGGAIQIVSNIKIGLNGSITANGGKGGVGSRDTSCGGVDSTYPYTDSRCKGPGGGGSGGAIRLIAPTIQGSGTLSASGGSTNHTLAGSPGRMRIETFNNQFTGTVDAGSQGSTAFSTPSIINPPSDAPSLRVVSVAGIAVPAKTDARFDPADLQINKNAAVPIIVAGSNIPLGTIVKVRISNEVGGIQELTTTLTSGTVASSTGTVTALIPHGFSRFTVEASWAAP